MKSIIINGRKRENLGKSSTSRLRYSEEVPCVLYYRKGENIHFSTYLSSFRKLVYTPNSYTVIIEWEEGEKSEALLKQIQFHPVSNKILHADFCKLDINKIIVMPVPIKTIGRSIGVSQGGNLRLILRKLLVKAFPKNIPDYFEIDITFLAIGDRVYIKDILNDNYIFMHSNDTVILTIKS
ncbi:50S ribosomal protein L25/general stress protein Ctc [Candidatus Uzinura diaspidicola str. ASNER]|uniref:Large ribosomal subunit protein bL25 n=1 Tax=Candidatus Uzinura diaspidicola str. ASNER TaxID=1133592 RepID=L7VJG9_9FLAO|nr:50S ribosomal protein L25/general stress protein Ctc [Candidatus Uzinura diaspidicola str. ASNER]